MAWLGCHFHYHGDQDLLLRDLLAPRLGDSLAAGAIDRFFFVRYALGGPHVRLRCRLAPGADAGQVVSAMAAAAQVFFARHPSRQPWSEEQMRRRNRAILAGDPAEHDDSIYPDESFRVAPFQPETERYGGAGLLAASLELFTLSSVAALETLAGCGTAGCGTTRGRQLNAFFRHLGGHAWGAVASGEELLDLLDSLCRAAGETFPRVLARADRTFAEQPEVFARLLACAMDDSSGEAVLAAGAAWLRCRLAAFDERRRRSITASHLHMSANRLGLSNAEEAYLYRLLQRAAEAVRDTRGDLWSRQGCGLAQRAARMGQTEGELANAVSSILEAFVSCPAAVSRSGYH